MRFPWRNQLAYVLLGVALLQYVLSGFALLPTLSAMSGGSGFSPIQEIDIIVRWLTAPVTIIGWAAVVEYLSRIADALQRRPH